MLIAQLALIDFTCACTYYVIFSLEQLKLRSAHDLMHAVVALQRVVQSNVLVLAADVIEMLALPQAQPHGLHDLALAHHALRALNAHTDRQTHAVCAQFLSLKIDICATNALSNR